MASAHTRRGDVLSQSRPASAMSDTKLRAAVVGPCRTTPTSNPPNTAIAKSAIVTTAHDNNASGNQVSSGSRGVSRTTGKGAGDWGLGTGEKPLCHFFAGCDSFRVGSFARLPGRASLSRTIERNKSSSVAVGLSSEMSSP
jgi:hypothetical protein